MFGKKFVVGVIVASVLSTGCEKTKRKTVVVADAKQTEEISELKKEREELAKKLELSNDPTAKDRLDKLESDLAARDAEIKEKDALIKAKEKELEEAKKGHDFEEVARLQKELDTLRGETVKAESEYKAALAAKQALIDAAERDRIRLEKLLDFSFKKNIQNREELKNALDQGVAEAEGRAAVLVEGRTDLKADIAAGYERILLLQQKYVHPVEDMLADKKALEALESRTEEQEAKLQNLREYFNASEQVDARSKIRTKLATDRDTLEQERDTIAAQLETATQEESRLLDEIVKLSETDGTQPTEKMKDLITRRNAKLAEVADFKARQVTNNSALEQNTRDTDTIDVEIASLKETTDKSYEKYQNDTVQPSRDELKKAEAEQSERLASYKQNGKDLESAKASLAEVKDLRDFMVHLAEPKEPKAD